SRSTSATTPRSSARNWPSGRRVVSCDRLKSWRRASRSAGQGRQTWGVSAPFRLGLSPPGPSGGTLAHISTTAPPVGGAARSTAHTEEGAHVAHFGVPRFRVPHEPSCCDPPFYRRLRAGH